MTYIRHISTITTVSLLVAILAFGMLFVPVANAEMITKEQVEQQEIQVKVQLVRTLEEQVKLLQMMVIRHLEARVVLLQAQQSNNGN